MKGFSKKGQDSDDFSWTVDMVNLVVVMRGRLYLLIVDVAVIGAKNYAYATSTSTGVAHQKCISGKASQKRSMTLSLNWSLS